MGGPHMGRVMLGAAEQTFVATVDRASTSVASSPIVIAAVVGLPARPLPFSRPIRRLEQAAEKARRRRPRRTASKSRARRKSPRSATRSTAWPTRSKTPRSSAAGSSPTSSHELRNPIAAARAQAEGMAEGVIATDSSRLESLVDDLKHLSSLVDDLQELAIAESGRTAYDMSAARPRRARRARDRSAPQSVAKPGVTVSLDHSASAAHVLGDEMRLSEVLRNLLCNALRHTARGTVARLGAASRRLDRSSRARTRARASPRPICPFVFERFYRADAARAAETGGAGLGLAISRHIVEDHGGEVFARDNDGAGATVGFRIPTRD